MQPNEQHEEMQTHLFAEEDVIHMEDASTGQRFLNFLVDALLIQYGLAFLTGGIIAIALFSIFPELAEGDLQQTHPPTRA
jgi:hypothetical protein